MLKSEIKDRGRERREGGKEEEQDYFLAVSAANVASTSSSGLSGCH